MNIRDFKPFPTTFEDMFVKQKELKFLFEPSAKELFDNFDIDTFEDQETFKKYCWRITEEITEAIECREDDLHFKEELIDGFNFLIELYLLYGWGIPELGGYVTSKKGSFEVQALNVIYKLGLAANCLKNRQWRRSQYLVDLYVFEPRLKKIWREYIKLMSYSGMSTQEIQDCWSLKYQVNKFRIESNY